MKHIVLVNESLHGLEYGMLRDLEDEIVRLTGAERVLAPNRTPRTFIGERMGHGMRFSGLRKWVPKEHHELRADVLWVILMGPENFTLDLYKGWDKHVGLKILYLFDTFDAQFVSIRRVMQATDWDFASTAFHGAKPLLEEATQRKWHLVRQAVNLERFHPASYGNRLIDFCAYGRRLETVHEAVKAHCRATGRYYDYTTAAAIQSHLDARDHYAQYAWHLCHSVFNFCWPVEVTHPGRATLYSPITCRWFEAAASGNVILGQRPAEPGFTELFGADAVIEIDHENVDLAGLCEQLWDKRECHLQAARERREKLAPKWSWESRISEILKYVGLDLPYEKGLAGAANH